MAQAMSRAVADLRVLQKYMMVSSCDCGPHLRKRAYGRFFYMPVWWNRYLACSMFIPGRCQYCEKRVAIFVQDASPDFGRPVLGGSEAGFAFADSAGVAMQRIFLADADRPVYGMRDIGNVVSDMRDLKLRDGKLLKIRGREGAALGVGRHLQCHIGGTHMFGHFADLVLHRLEPAHRPAKLLALGSIVDRE